MQREFCRGENASCIKYELHTFSAVHISGCILYVCTFFYTTERRHKMHTQASPAACCRHKVHILPGHPLRPVVWLYQPPGLRFSRHKVHTLGRPVSRHKVHIFTAPPFPLLFYICFLFLQKVHILAGHRCSRQGKRKSAYTRRTPGAEQQPAKSAYTSRTPSGSSAGKKCAY